MTLLEFIFLFTQIFGQIVPPNCPSDKVGDGWVLIRRTASTLNPKWHFASDDLALTETYDIGSTLSNCVTDEICAVESNAEFSKNASIELPNYNQLLFASGDCEFWIMVNKTETDFISVQAFSSDNFQAIRSSEPENECKGSTSSPHGYTQAAVLGLPFLCETGNISHPCLGAKLSVRFYYAENSVTNNIDTISNNNGMNVWVREFSTTYNLDTCAPTASPTPGPTDSPTPAPSNAPTLSPTPTPSISPTPSPTPAPSDAPSMSPTPAPSLSPTPAPSNSPTPSPTPAPSDSPTLSPTPSPSLSPTPAPSYSPTPSPTSAPTDSPTPAPSISPTPAPSNSPTPSPTPAPSGSPTLSPTPAPTVSPTPVPTYSPTPAPSLSPTPSPSLSPTPAPSISPTPAPSLSPTPAPSNSPTPSPSPAPTASPTPAPSISPTPSPTEFPSRTPIKEPTLAPTQTNPILFNNYIDGTKWAWSQWAVLSGILLIICLIILICFLWYRHRRKVKEHEEQLKQAQEKELEKQQNEQDFTKALTTSGVAVNSINSVSKENNKTTTDGDNEFDTGIDVGVTTPEDDSKAIELVVPENTHDDTNNNNDNNNNNNDDDDNEITHVLVTPNGNDDNVSAPEPPKAPDGIEIAN